MGKYTKVLGNIPKILDTDAKRQEKLNEVKAKLRGTPGFKQQASALVKDYIEARQAHEEAERQAKESKLLVDALAQLIAEQYEVEGITNLRLDEDNSVGVQPEPYPSIIDKDAFREWCIEEGLLRSLQLPYKSLESLVKQRLLEGMEPPPGVTVFAKDKVVWR